MTIENHHSSDRKTNFKWLTLCCVALFMSGCTTIDKLETQSIAKDSGHSLAKMNTVQLNAAEEKAGMRYEKNPKNAATATRYAQILQMTGKNEQALAVMQQAAIHNPDNRQILADYGKAQASAGKLQDALQTIQRAQTPDRPDWKLLSAEGAILDQMGAKDEARVRYRKALELKPNEPSVLSNMAMSYLLEDDLKMAEKYLQKAVKQPDADSRVRQNLALVVGLQGRYAEAENIARNELSETQAQANIAYLKQML